MLQQTKKFLKWLFPFAFGVGGVANMSQATSLTSEVGTQGSSFLLAHGVTAPVLGGVLLTVSFAMMAYHIERAKKPVEFLDQRSQRIVKKVASLDKKYGPNWMDRIEAVLQTVKQLDSKKK